MRKFKILTNEYVIGHKTIMAKNEKDARRRILRAIKDEVYFADRRVSFSYKIGKIIEDRNKYED